MTKVKERPIVLSRDMVSALLDGRKTQTRRPACKYLNAEPDAYTLMGTYEDGRGDFQAQWKHPDHFRQHGSPFGKPGDRLWVRETLSIPRLDSRITLEVTRVWVERLQHISNSAAEGIKLTCENCGEPFCVDKCAMGYCWKPECGSELWSYTRGFQRLWDARYGKKYPWKINPWVWVAEFKKKETP